MSCGGKIYKGGLVTVSVPFSVEGFENLSISYYTIGDYKITKSEEDLEIEDGFITYTFTKEELDAMPDGVMSYLVSYDLDGGSYMDGGSTSVFLKTPAGYSAASISDIVASAMTEGYESGYTEGAANQKSLMVETAFTSNQTYERADGWNKVTVAVAHSDTYEEGFEDGVESGRTYQKSLMISTTFGSNGQYREENGYNDFTIAVETNPYFVFSGTFVTTEDISFTDEVDWENKSPIMDNGGGWASYQSIDGIEYDYYWHASLTLHAGTHTYTCAISEFHNVSTPITKDTIELRENPFFDWNSGDIKLFMTKND